MFNKLFFLFASVALFAANTGSACPEGEKKYCVTHRKTGDIYCRCSFDPDYKPRHKIDNLSDNVSEQGLVDSDQAYFALSTEKLFCISTIVGRPALKWNIQGVDLHTAVRHTSLESNLFSSLRECERTKDRLIQLHESGVVLSYAMNVTNHKHCYPKIAECNNWAQENLIVRFDGLEFRGSARLK
jgi:hypothetical protein